MTPKTMDDADKQGGLRGERLVVLRDLKGLTQGELAEKLKVSQSFISHVEKGSRPLPITVAIEASTEFKLPASFFSVGQGVTEMGQHTFRKLARASARDERRVKALFDEAARFFFGVSAAAGYKTVDLPDPADYIGDPEECAEALRESAGLGPEDPVKNMTRLIERRGVGVITHLDDTTAIASDHFGISRPSQLNGRPLVAITHQLPGAVQRNSLAHELGHLIFDGNLTAPVSGTRASEEARAFRFASALLIPQRVMVKRVTSTLSLHGYLRIKADYGISVAATVRRAKDLGIIAPERYRSLNIQLSSQGWRTNEPVDVAIEEPRLLGQSLAEIYGENGWRISASQYGLDPALLTRWLPAKRDIENGPTAKILSPRRWGKRSDTADS
jgi:Zn-dependent peptidase ImmA (M78 family)/DNA-binding XRE family transcriptional regulator